MNNKVQPVVYTSIDTRNVFNEIIKLEAGKSLFNTIPEIENLITHHIMKEFGLHNIYQIPRLERIVISVGPNNSSNTPLTEIAEWLQNITGQTPIYTFAKKSMDMYKTRRGAKLGVKVTLSGANMRNFFIKFKYCALNDVHFSSIKCSQINQTKTSCQLNIGIQNIGILPEVPYRPISQAVGCTITFISKYGTKTPLDRMLYAAYLHYLGLPIRERIEMTSDSMIKQQKEIQL